MRKAIVLSVIFSVSVLESVAQLKADHLLTENLVNPVGLDVQQPRFSWQLQSEQKEVLQTAYEIKVMNGNIPVWNSGKTASGQSVHVPYQGLALQSGVKYNWQVRVWDNKGKASAFSGPASFRVGLLAAAGWKAKWIEPVEEENAMRPCPLLRRSFGSNKKITSAVAYITAHGIYEADINGKRIGTDYFAPGWTSYKHRVQYQVYEVTDLVKNGNNTINVLLGSGWWRGRLGWEGKKDHYGKKLALLFQLELTYSDGSKEWINSDDSWQSAVGPVRYADFYNGSVIDARKEYGNWTAVKVADYPYTDLVATVSEPVKKRETFQPLKVFVAPNGDTLADFGQNLVGWIKLKVRGNAGDTIRLDHAEVLDKAGNFYDANMRGARPTDVYILKGGGEEYFEPQFTFHGFRYARLKGFRGIPASGQLEAVAIYSGMPATGTFECSNTLINQLQHNIMWSQNGNFVDVPTDCPQRDERLGWMGDAQLFSRTAAFNKNVNNFFAKWLADVALEQDSMGRMPVLVPDILGDAGAAAGWADAIVIIPWTMYQAYGDKGLLLKQYPSMKAYVDYLQKNSTGYLRNKTFQFGDWLSFTTNGPADVNTSAVTDLAYISNAFFAYSTRLLVNAAKALGNEKDAAYYNGLLENIKSAFVNEYLAPSGRLVSNTQTAYVLALQFDLLPENKRAAAAAKLVENIKTYDHITTGLLGTPFICHVLTRFGYTDVAYRLLLREEYPGWLYPVKRGATTIWERWDGIRADGSFQNPTMNSFNHYAYGAIGDWIYRAIAGIDTDPIDVGYKKIIIKPHPGGELSYAKASLQTYYGRVAVDWKTENGKFRMDVEIPANTTATVFVPKTADAASYDTVSVGSGSYHFESK